MLLSEEQKTVLTQLNAKVSNFNKLYTKYQPYLKPLDTILLPAIKKAEDILKQYLPLLEDVPQTENTDPIAYGITKTLTLGSDIHVSFQSIEAGVKVSIYSETVDSYEIDLDLGKGSFIKIMVPKEDILLLKDLDIAALPCKLEDIDESERKTKHWVSPHIYAEARNSKAEKLKVK